MDKKSVKYFTTTMKQEQFTELVKKHGITKYKFNTINYLDKRKEQNN